MSVLLRQTTADKEQGIEKIFDVVETYAFGGNEGVAFAKDEHKDSGNVVESLHVLNVLVAIDEGGQDFEELGLKMGTRLSEETNRDLGSKSSRLTKERFASFLAIDLLSLCLLITSAESSCVDFLSVSNSESFMQRTIGHSLRLKEWSTNP
eukprot:TRINITY_DN11000_c0_g4_i1.p2 TRINITY_DN11000_c0_g4~~TRINITY_DN11000_c0_g4_i1.p2  ORF type:complete len:151 (-),score=12.68 TRINITY_DN11000_c0_g4_i1:279-731(-)